MNWKDVDSKWMDQQNIDDYGTGDHNFCRNPEKKDGGIYCYVSRNGNEEQEYCDPLSINQDNNFNFITDTNSALHKNNWIKAELLDDTYIIYNHKP